MIFLRLQIFFIIIFYKLFFPGITSECQTICIQIRLGILSGHVERVNSWKISILAHRHNGHFEGISLKSNQTAELPYKKVNAF